MDNCDIQLHIKTDRNVTVTIEADDEICCIPCVLKFLLAFAEKQLLELHSGERRGTLN